MSDVLALKAAHAGLARRCQVMQAAIEEIERKLPACSAEAEMVWADRRWASEFRDLQGIARRALADAEGAA